MKAFFIVLLLALCIQVLSQKTDSVGYLSNLRGKGFCIRQGAQTNLKIPFFFYTGDKVNMVSGNAVIVLKSEEEVKLGSGETFTVVAQNSNQKKQNDLLMYRNTKQSTSSFKMRSIGEPAFLVFPNRSKLANTENAIILIKSKMKSKYFFKLADVETNNFVYKLSEVNDTLISLQSCDLKKGKAYTWTIRYPEFTISGDIQVITDEQKKSIPKFDFSNRASYTKAFNYYCDEDYFFDAYKVIEDAIKAYPEDGYFQYLKKSLFGL